MLSDYHRLTSDRRGRLETLAPDLEANLEEATLDEEKQADWRLSGIAENRVNEAATEG
jgi:hypothetical protein